MRPWMDRGIPVSQVYGLTETCPTATVVPIADARRAFATAGKPALYCDVRIVDAAGDEVAPGTVGEVLLRGPNLLSSYWRNEEATRAAFLDGWFRSGDAGYLDEDGFLHIVERMKDIIIVGGSNVYPADLERVLSESAEISEAAVVGRPDPDLGEVPVACVVPSRPGAITAEGVKALFRGRLAEYKHPRDVVLLERLPRNALGKIQKGQLRDLVSRTSAEPL